MVSKRMFNFFCFYTIQGTQGKQKQSITRSSCLMSYNSLLLRRTRNIKKKYEHPCMRLTHIFRSLLWCMCDDAKGHWGVS